MLDLLARARAALTPNRVQILCHDVLVVGALILDASNAFGSSPVTKAVVAGVAIATRGANTVMFLLGAQKSEELQATTGDAEANAVTGLPTDEEEFGSGADADPAPTGVILTEPAPATEDAAPRQGPPVQPSQSGVAQVVPPAPTPPQP